MSKVKKITKVKIMMIKTLYLKSLSDIFKMYSTTINLSIYLSIDI